jgi:pimeloyl-ACP methyl ester carboxylesterase
VKRKAIVLGGALAAIGAGGWAAWKRRAPWQAPLPEGIIRDVAGARIHYIDEGSGPAIVLIHGFAGSTFSWRHVIPLLATTHRVVALDLPGFGFSDRDPALDYSQRAQAERVVGLMDLLGIQRATLIGHSMGGAIAERAAAAHPGRVQRLVLVASVNAGEPQDPRRRGMAAGPMFALAGAVQRSPTAMYALGRRALARMVHDRAFATEEVMRGYIDPLLLPGTVAAVRKMAVANRDTPPVDLSAITAPTLVLSGAGDRAIPPERGEALAAAIPGARHVTIPGAGHLAAEERPGAFLEEVRAFLHEPVTA